MIGDAHKARVRGQCYTALLRRINTNTPAVTPKGMDFPLAEIVNSLELPENNAAAHQACHRILDQKINDAWKEIEAKQSGRRRTTS